MSDDDKDFSAFIREHASRHRADPSLESAIRTRLALQAGAAMRPQAPVRPGWFAWLMPAAGFAAGILVSLAVMLAGGYPNGQRSELTRADDELTASHVRSLMAGHLTDVASTDQHTVKPWFQGKLDYSPPVHDFASDGFPLVGGRLDYLGGRPVAALVYRHGQHVVNLFIWPGSSAAGESLSSRNGFQVLSWSDQGMQYRLVSDTEAQGLTRLSQLWRQADQTQR